MKYDVIIHHEVYEEINEAVLYYNQKQKGLGDKLFDEAVEIFTRLETDPLLFQKYKAEYRQVMLKKFPYLVIYFAYETKVLVYRFIHAKKQPAKRYK